MELYIFIIECEMKTFKRQVIQLSILLIILIQQLYIRCFSFQEIYSLTFVIIINMDEFFMSAFLPSTHYTLLCICMNNNK
jgi:hypothetical protein